MKEKCSTYVSNSFIYFSNFCSVLCRAFRCLAKGQSSLVSMTPNGANDGTVVAALHAIKGATSLRVMA